jgi:formamidopyrimidine-DNA glycosylase
VAGVGNIYASEALFRAKISPFQPARTLRRRQIRRLHEAIREVLNEAIERGSTVPLNFSGNGSGDGLFYYGSAAEAPEGFEERLQVYDREGQPCCVCGRKIKRAVQAARSTFYCPKCQRG